MKLKIHKEQCIDRNKGYSFSLFPVVTLDKVKFIKRTEYNLLLGFFFWYFEFQFEIKK